MLTKTQLCIMELFVSKINERFSIKKVSEILKKPYPLVHRSIKGLVEGGFINRDMHKLLSLNYKINQLELAYIESLRKKRFLEKNKTITLFVNDVLDKTCLDFFVFAIFGSSVESRHPRDVDVLLIVGDKDGIGAVEKLLQNLASNFSLDFDINVISVESVYEMLAKRDEANLVNETLDNHIIIFGAENYYRLLKNAR